MEKIDLQIDLIKRLQMNIEKMEKECSSIKNNIQANGITANFSINTNIYQIATDIYKDCSMLGYIKNFNLQIGDKNERS